MLSDFNKSAGGMETWAYGFIPILLNKNTHIKMNIFGLSQEDISNENHELISFLSSDAKPRLNMTFFKVIWPKIPWVASMLFQFRNHSKKSLKPSPDMVLCVGGFFELICMFFSGRYSKTKKVLWLRTIFFNEKANKVPSFLLPFGRWLEAKLLKKLDLLLANGTDISNHYGNYGLEVNTIRNGVDIKKWKTNDPKLNLPINVAFIGRLASAKGIEEFLLAVENIKTMDISEMFKFTVIGDGPYSSKVVNLEERGYLDYLGMVDKDSLPSLLSNIDVCVALTRVSKMGGGGGTSNALLEQMAAGRIIVAWDNLIFRQILDDKSAYLCEQDNINMLTKKFLDIKDNRESAKLKAIHCKEIIKEFSIESQVKKFESVVGDCSFE